MTSHDADVNATSLLFLELLRNQIDITRVPFSDRGSRLLVYQDPGQSRLFIKLAERLADLEPGIDAYIRRPPFIRDLVLIDKNGEALEFRLQSESGGELKSVRNLAYTTNGAMLKNRITPERDGYTIECIVRAGDDCAITLHVSSKNNLHHEAAPFSQSCALAEDRWKKWFSRVPPVDERYRRTYAYAWWVMANNLVSPLDNVACESMMPSKIAHIGIWL